MHICGVSSRKFMEMLIEVSLRLNEESNKLLDRQTAGTNMDKGVRMDKGVLIILYMYVYIYIPMYTHVNMYIIYPLATNSIIFAKAATVQAGSCIRYETCILCQKAPAHEYRLPRDQQIDSRKEKSEKGTGSCLAVPS